MQTASSVCFCIWLLIEDNWGDQMLHLNSSHFPPSTSEPSNFILSLGLIKEKGNWYLAGYFNKGKENQKGTGRIKMSLYSLPYTLQWISGHQFTITQVEKWKMWWYSQGYRDHNRIVQDKLFYLLMCTIREKGTLRKWQLIAIHLTMFGLHLP